MSAMEITTLNHKTYQNEHNRICKGYEIAALKAMDNAAKDEAELAIKKWRSRHRWNAINYSSS